MKKRLLLFIIVILLFSSLVYAFSLNDFITQLRSKVTITGAVVVEELPIFYCSFDNTFECTNNQPIVNLHPSFEQGLINQAILLDNNDKLIYDSEDNIESDKGTIELWFKPLEDTDVAAILEDSESGNCGNFLFRLDTQNKISFNPKRGSRLNVVSDTMLELNRWYHIAVTWDSDQETRLYINGNLESAQVFTFTPENFRPQLRIGQPCGTRTYSRADGLIDELKIYNYVRTSEQILNDNQIISTTVQLTESNNDIIEEDINFSSELPLVSPESDKALVQQGFLGWLISLFS